MVIKQYATIKELPTYYPFMTVYAIRHMIKRNTAGINDCVLRLGHKILFDMQKLQSWMDKHTGTNEC